MVSENDLCVTKLDAQLDAARSMAVAGLSPLKINQKQKDWLVLVAAYC